MKTTVRMALLAGCLSASLNGADFAIGVAGSEGGIDSFAISIGNYYRVPEREIIVIERYIPREELSVVYLLANRSHRSVRYIIDLRLRGLSWWDITWRLGLDPYTLYIVDSRRHSGPPYGQAYGYHKEGKNYRLRDDEIIELANIRFLSKYHDVSYDDVIERRRQGEQYHFIDEHYRSQKVYPQQREGYQQREEYQQRDKYKQREEYQQRVETKYRNANSRERGQDSGSRGSVKPGNR